jgi:hypothetical protein
MSDARIEYLFLTPAPLVKINGQVTALDASARLGSLAPTRALMGLGYDARTFSTIGDATPATRAATNAKRVVFGEMYPTESGGWAETTAVYRSILAAIPDPPSRVVFSIADDHFDNPDFRDFYAAALPECRAVTTVSERLAQTLRKFTSRPVRVAPEPSEGERGAPQAFVARKPPQPLAWLARRIGLSSDLWRVRLMWFGYPANLPPLLELIPQLEALARRHPLMLTCVTSPVVEIQALMSEARTRESSALRVQFIAWSPLAMPGIIESHDMVLIPSDYRDPVKQAKSPNRLIAGVHGGRFVVAHPLPAYAPYAPFAWIGEDLCEGVQWAIRHPREVVERISRGQAHIDQHHSAEAVARFWLDVLDSGD